MRFALPALWGAPSPFPPTPGPGWPWASRCASVLGPHVLNPYPRHQGEAVGGAL